MLTGLLMLWMAAGEARGQVTIMYDYHQLYTEVQSVGLGRGVGCSVWYDGTTMRADEVDDGLGGVATNIVMTHANGDPPDVYTVSGFPGMAEVVPTDQCIGKPDVVEGSDNLGYPVCYTVGMFVTFPPPPSEEDITYDTDEGSGGASCPQNLVRQGWVVRADHDMSLPFQFGYTNNASPRIFCSDTGCAPLCADTGKVWDFTALDRAPVPYLAVGGWFEGTTQFEYYPTGSGCQPSISPLAPTAIGDRDGFLVLLNTTQCLPVKFSGSSPYFLQLGAVGETVEVHGVSAGTAQISSSGGAFWGNDAIVVCGSFTGTVNFDPYNQTPVNRTSGGRSDMFVAVYNVSNTKPGCALVSLEWVWTGGTADDDCAEKVAWDDGGEIYVAGWTGRVSSGPSDIFLARFEHSPISNHSCPPGPFVGAPKWTATHGTPSTDEAALDVAIDGIGRPVFSGYFEGSLGINPGEVPLLVSTGGRDGWVARYEPLDATGADDMNVDWRVGYGGTDDDEVNAVAVDMWNSGRISYVGQQDETTMTGVAFERALEPRAVSAPSQVVNVIIDNSSKDSSAKDLALDVASAVTDSTVLPDGTDTAQPRVLLAVVLSGADNYYLDPTQSTGSGKQSVQIIPYTTITPVRAELIARRLDTYYPLDYFGSQGQQHFDHGLTLAGRTMNALHYPTGTAADRTGHVLLVGNTGITSDSTTQLASSRDIAIATDEVDHIHGLIADADVTAFPPFLDRDFVFSHLAESDIDFPSAWSGSTLVPPERADLSMAAETVDSLGSTGFQDLLARMLTRMAHREGDYDRDGVVEFTFGGSCFGCTTTGLAPCGEDWTKFRDDAIAGSLGVPNKEYADWNFDLFWNGQTGAPLSTPNNFGVDFSKFFTGALGGCP